MQVDGERCWIIEAVARTPVMGLREDVVIRVLPDGDGSRIDIRSSSRHFESDLGSNAARIASLIDALNEIAEDNVAPAAPAKTQDKSQARTQAKGKR